MNQQMQKEAQPELSTYSNTALNETDLLAEWVCWLFGSSVQKNRERVNRCSMNLLAATWATRQGEGVFALFVGEKEGETHKNKPYS